MAKTPEQPRLFLLGPPAVGKTTLGRRACDALGLRFADLASLYAAGSGAGLAAEAFDELLRQVLEEDGADVVEIPWPLQQDRRVLKRLRQSGITLLLWDHPEDVQARSGQREPLFTPGSRTPTRGGFGRTGTGCREFRRIDRASEESVFFIGLSLDAAAAHLEEVIADIREEQGLSPAEREGLSCWIEDWRVDHDASPEVSAVIVEAMARHLAARRASGASPRTLAPLRSDLNAAGHLVLMYDEPKRRASRYSILRCFDSPPWEISFARKFDDSPRAVARYERNLEGFAQFLRDSGELKPEDELA